MKLKYIFTGVLAATFLMSSCSDMLDIKQHSVSNVETYYGNDAEAEEGIVAVYGAVRSLDNGTSSPWFVMNMLSDDCWVGGGGHYDSTNYMLGDYTFGTDFGAIKSIYSNLYTIIYRCNVVIERVKGESAVMKRAIAEAKVFRAFANFYLASLWGTAPCVLKTLQEAEYMQANSAPGELWNAVETDLNEAISSGALEQKKSVNDKLFRASKQFAQALLGKAYLFQKKYSDAASMLNSVVDSKLYELESDLSNVGVPEGNGSKENIFEINTIEDKNVGANSNMKWVFMGLRGEKYNNSKGILTGQSFGFQNPTKDLYDAFVAVEGVDGYRLKNTIANREQMKEQYGVENNQDITDNEGYWDVKDRILTKHFLGYWYACNQRVMRLNEVLMLGAEANLLSGDQAKANDYIARIRERAQAPAVSGDVTMDIIKAESRLELAFDGSRYMNIVRWGDAAKLLAGKGDKNPVLRTMEKGGGVDWEKYNDGMEHGFKAGKHELFPFPAAETSVNGNIKQNPGW